MEFIVFFFFFQYLKETFVRLPQINLNYNLMLYDIRKLFNWTLIDTFWNKDITWDKATFVSLVCFLSVCQALFVIFSILRAVILQRVIL